MFLLILQKTEDEPIDPETQCTVSVRPAVVTKDTRVTPCSILLDARDVRYISNDNHDQIYFITYFMYSCSI
jgi:hypothetical protein